MRFLLFMAICCFVCFQSCTIEKRHFLPGYHIDWKNRGHIHGKEADSMINEPVLTQLYVEPVKNVDTVYFNDFSAGIDSVLPPANMVDPFHMPGKKPVKQAKENESPGAETRVDNTGPDHERKLHWTGTAGIMLEVLFTIVLLVELAIEVYVLDYVTGVITIVLFLLSIFSLIFLRNKKDTYKGRVVYWLGLFWWLFFLTGMFFLYLS